MGCTCRRIRKNITRSQKTSIGYPKMAIGERCESAIKELAPLVSIVISNYNDKSNLRECLESLRTLCYANYETIVVDCGSGDGSAEMVSNEFPKVKLLRVSKIGIGEALNIGLSKAKGDMFLLELNSDDVVHPNFLKALVEALSNTHNAALVCGKRLVYGKSLIDSVGGKVDMLTGIAPSLGSGKLDSSATNRVMEVDYAGVYLIKKKVIETIGNFDPDYFIYFEDTDLCFRAKLFGFKMFFVPGAVVWHKGSSTVKYRSQRYQYYMRRNNYRFVVKNFPVLFMLTSLLTQFLLSMSFFLFFAFQSRLDLVSSEYSALKWIFLNFRNLLQIRTNQKSILSAFKKNSSKALFF